MYNVLMDYMTVPSAVGFGLALIMFIAVICVAARNRLLSADLYFARKLSEYGVDGYFAFIGKRTECSKQLAILLMLKDGENSSFSDVLAGFHDDDASGIMECLKHDNSVLKIKTKNDLCMAVTCRIFYDSDDGELAKVLYFRNITDDQTQFDEVSDFGRKVFYENQMLRRATDALPLSFFIRDDGLNVVYGNDVYINDNIVSDKQNTSGGLSEPLRGDGVQEARSLAAAVRRAGAKMGRLCHGDADIEKYITEIPFMIDGKIYSIGYYDEEDCAAPQKNHLSEKDFMKLFDAENTAVAYFSDDLSLTASNTVFSSMWGLDADYIKQKPSYISFLDTLYLNKCLPVDCNLEELKQSDMRIIDAKKMQIMPQMVLPSGTIIKRILIGNIGGGFVIIWKNAADEAVGRKYQPDKTISFDVVNNLNEGVALFGANKTLLMYNRTFASMWNLDRVFLDSCPLITEVFERKKKFLNRQGEEWSNLRDSLLKRVLDCETVVVDNTNGKSYEIAGYLMADGSLMLRYADISERRLEKQRNSELKESFDVKHKMLTEFAFEMNRAIARNIGSLKGISGGKKLLSAATDKMLYLKEQIVKTIEIIDVDVNMHLVAPDVVDVKKMLISVLYMIEERISEKQIALTTNCPDDIDWITVDEKLIKHMMLFILNSVVLNIAPHSVLAVKVSKVRKKDIGENMSFAGGKDDDFYLVVEIGTEGHFLSESLDLFNIRSDDDIFGTKNRLIRKIIRIFDGFFIADSGKKTLKICLPYHN